MPDVVRWQIVAQPCGHVQMLTYVDDGVFRVAVSWPPGTDPVCGACGAALCGFEAVGVARGTEAS